MGVVVQRHMFATDVRFLGRELTLLWLPELSGANLDAVDVLSNSADHVSACEQGLGAMSAHRPGSQYPHRVTT